MCSSTSKYRALLAVLRYGRHCAYARFGADETQLTEELAEATFGGPSVEDMIRQAEETKAAMEEQLPGMPPEDWSMLVSKLLLDSYQTAIRDNHSKWGLELEPMYIVALRQKLLTSASGVVQEDAMLPLYPYVDDRDDNIAIHTAIVGGGDFLVTQKRDLYMDPNFGHRWEHPETGRSVLAVPFERLVEMVTTLHFDFTAVNPRLW